MSWVHEQEQDHYWSLIKGHCLTNEETLMWWYIATVKSMQVSSKTQMTNLDCIHEAVIVMYRLSWCLESTIHFCGIL